MKRKMAPCPYQGKPDSWRTIWKIPGGDPDLYIVREQDQRGCEEPLHPSAAYGILDLWAVDRDARREFLSLYQALRVPYLGHNVNDAVIQDAVKPRLRQAFERGELLLIRVPPMGIAAAEADALLAPEQAHAAAPPPRQTAKTWVEVHLVDMEGNPVGGKHYLIRTPSGAVEEGNLDSSGRVRINNIDPGTCMISFPDLDREAWERAS
jgi:hypothetical protein